VQKLIQFLLKISSALSVSCSFLSDAFFLCPGCIPSADCDQSRNPGTGDLAAELHDWLSFWQLKLVEEKLFVANQRELMQPGKGEGEPKTRPPCCLLPDPVWWPQMVPLESPRQPIYGLSLSACVKEGENWAVVNLMFPSNHVIPCSRSLKGNSCSPAPLPSCLGGHLPLCGLQLREPGAVESEDDYSVLAFFQISWGRARKHKKGALLMVCNR